MELVEPIRDIDEINKIKLLLKASRNGDRDTLIFDFGIHSGLRISDILKIRVFEIKNKKEFTLKEKKTNKNKTFPIKEEIKKEIIDFIAKENLNDNDFLFSSQKTKGNAPLTREQFYRKLNKVANKLGINYKIGTHSLRKTFGYHFYQQTKDLTLLQQIFNHSNSAITLRYIGITQDNINSAYKAFDFKEKQQEAKNEIINRIDKLEETIIDLLDYIQKGIKKGQN